jgi:hypothetical protein
MRLVIKKGDTSVNELRFSRGPIYIGRQIGSQVFLADKAVSRLHAVIYTSKTGQWVVEDLDSPNKTFLNGAAIHKAPLRNGDSIKISDFTIAVSLEGAASDERAIDLGDTVTAATLTAPAAGALQQQVTIRRYESEDAPMIRLPAKRMRDYKHLTDSVLTVARPDPMAHELADILLKQMSGFHAWIGFRSEASGSMTTRIGKKRSAEGVDFKELMLGDVIMQAVEKHELSLIPRINKANGTGGDAIRSAIIAPVMILNDCHGVIYIANSVEHEHYTVADVDYIAMVAIHTAALLGRMMTIL